MPFALTFCASFPIDELSLDEEEIEAVPNIITKSASVQRFTVGEPFVLECMADSADGVSVDYSWMKNGQQLEVDSIGHIFRESATKNGNILIFPQDETEDEGTYQCVAENAALPTERRLVAGEPPPGRDGTGRPAPAALHLPRHPPAEAGLHILAAAPLRPRRQLQETAEH